MGRTSQPRDRRGRWTTTGRGASLGSQRSDFARALQHGPGGDNGGRSTVYAYLRDKDSPSGKAGSPYYVGVAGSVGRPYAGHGRTPVPRDERRIRMLRSNMTHEQAREWEKFYIQKYGRRDIGSGRKMLINHTDGGDGAAGLRHTTNAKTKMRAAHQGKSLSAEHKAKLSVSGRGRVASEETRAKLSARPVSPETRAKLTAANLRRSEQLSLNSARGVNRHDSATDRKRAEAKAISTANKYGISLAEYSSLTPKERNTLAQRFRRGQRGADLLATSTDIVKRKVDSARTTRAAATAAKYGIESSAYSSLDRKQKNTVASRFRRGVRGASLLHDL